MPEKFPPVGCEQTPVTAGRSFAALVTWTARTGDEQAVQEILEQLAIATRAEPDCLQYIAHRSLDDLCRYLIYERYANRDAFERHLESDHFRALALEQEIPRLENRTREFCNVVV